MPTKKTTSTKPAAKPKAPAKTKGGIANCKNMAGENISIVRAEIQAVEPCAAKGGDWDKMFDVHLNGGKTLTVDRNPLK